MQPVYLRRRCVRRLRLKFVQARGLLRMYGQVRTKCAADGMLARSWPNGSGAPGLLLEELCEVPLILLEEPCEAPLILLEEPCDALPMLREALREWLRGVPQMLREELRGVQQTQCAKCFDPTRLQCWQLLKDPYRYRTETPTLYRYPRARLKS